MRIWSIHPKHLDAKGLVALWRETLLAKHVLEGKTKGYTKHPQLHRFKEHVSPVECINYYLSEVLLEAKRRGYNFNESKVDRDFQKHSLNVTNKQLDFERQHLLNKLKQRDKQRYTEVHAQKNLELHPMFVEVHGEIETWEII